MPETLQLASPTPLTTLTEDEVLFRDNIRQFADEKVRPLVKEMDEKGIFEKDLIHDFFQLGLMGIEIPQQYGGGGGKFFEAILAVEELSRVDASSGVIVDVQNTLVNNALLRWGNEDQKKRYLPKMASETVGAYALSEAGSGSDAFALQTRATLQGTPSATALTVVVPRIPVGLAEVKVVNEHLDRTWEKLARAFASNQAGDTRSHSP